MKFIADGMLGKLTRWLRMLGQDVAYSSDLDDRQLVVVAKKKRRILLTRDLELYQQATAKGIDAFYLDASTEAEKLAQLAKRFKIKLAIDMTTSRCPKCNTRVKPISKEKVTDKVEKNTLEYYTEFWQCPTCKQIFWQGAHWTRIRKTLAAANESLEKPLRKEQENA